MTMHSLWKSYKNWRMIQFARDIDIKIRNLIEIGDHWTSWLVFLLLN